MTERDVKELLGHMVMQMREAEMLIESLRAENEALKAGTAANPRTPANETQRTAKRR